MRNDTSVRLHVYLAQCGVGSRRTCETYMADGLIAVDGAIVTQPGSRVTGTERITFRGKRVLPEKRKRYVALNKPPGFLTSSFDPEGRPLAMALLERRYKERLFHVGRLDFDSSGLIFFTNDGEFARVVTHPSSGIEKEYLIESPNILERTVLMGFVNGVRYQGSLYRIDSFELKNPHRALLRLHEGKNRELRELFRSAGYRIRKLHRIRIGNVRLGDLSSGEHRELSEREINWFLKGKSFQSNKSRGKNDQ